VSEPCWGQCRDAEVLLSIKEFAHLFHRNTKALYRKAKRGGWEDARLIAGQWYVRVLKRDVEAARNTRAA
jgi:hypothetical protein